MRILNIFAATGAALLVLAAGAGAETSRPIEEFVDAQGTFCFPDGMGGCILFVPPIENFIGQSDPANGLLSSVDYAGLADSWIQDTCGLSFGTTFGGTVSEEVLEDGRALVHVTLQTRNALSWVTDGGDFNNPLLFGARAPDVCNGDEPSLGSMTLVVDFINPAPGDPLPDLLQILAAPLEGQEVLKLLMRARADGDLRAAFGVPDGTRGRFYTTQNGLLMTPFMGAVADGFPVERIRLRAVGRGPAR